MIKYMGEKDCMLSLLKEHIVESSNPGRVNKINRVSKFSSISNSFTLVCHYTRELAHYVMP